MKATHIIGPGCILGAVGLVICLMYEHQACVKLDAQNDALKGQLSKMAELTAENERLSNLLAQASALRQQVSAATDERVAELERLRTEVEAAHQQSNDIASLRKDTVATRAALDDARKARRASQRPSRPNTSGANGAPFEILEARYGTDRTNMDVVAELNDRIRNGSLKIIANNNLTGDPDFGQVKSLTVIYNYGGAVLTNQFREGDMVILPPMTP